MVNIKNFTKYIPENPVFPGASCLISEDGHDWYECQELFAEETYKIAYDSDGIVRSISGDVSSLFPVNLSVAEVETLPEGVDINGGWYYQNGEVLPVPVDYAKQAETQRQRLLSEAGDVTSDQVTELLLGIISDEDKEILTAWQLYIRALKALDLSAVSDEASFDAIEWPVSPQTAMENTAA
ncbi:TPA: tail fiber assembly protein [Escherichia coli]|nr:tail fiber assembly protein [Escherichia coli]MED9700700.1 tail fiber assembly protein [Escherichia coli]HAY0227943.1 tail fiber assembly protein [Escherichia coli]HEL8019935.1 tail fiber assembly protein [Escherichia coli]HEL8086204.1 tail fiber assembly protein [Escherichia coli]